MAQTLLAPGQVDEGTCERPTQAPVMIAIVPQDGVGGVPALRKPHERVWALRW